MQRVPTYLLPHRVTLRTPTGESSNGPVYATTKNVPCRVTFAKLAARKPVDVGVSYSVSVVFQGDIVVAENTEITFNQTKFKVVQVAPEYDLWGHTVLQVVYAK